MSARRYAAGGAIAAAIAAGSVRAGALTPGGGLAATAIGAATFGALGWRGTAVLLGFFVPSVALSRVGQTAKRRIVDVGKHGARDAAQVLANGGCAALCALVAQRAGARWETAFAGAFAAAAADTWATEVGTLVGGTPRSILTGAALARGLSGGITAAGTAASVAGAGFVAAVAASAGVAGAPAILAGGIIGSLADSALGASLQALRWCAACGRSCETDPHACGTPTTLARGAAWIDNDVVNAIAGAAGALAALAFAR